MIREVMWSAWDGFGLGHLSLAVRDGGGAENLTSKEANQRDVVDESPRLGIEGKQRIKVVVAALGMHNPVPDFVNPRCHLAS